MRQILESLAWHSEETGRIDLSGSFIDGAFVVGKRGIQSGKDQAGQEYELMAIADAYGLPLAVHTASVSPHEVTLVEVTLDETVTVGQPRRLVGIAPTRVIHSIKSWHSVASN